VRKQLTYANVMATIAVFIALGGGAYALSLPKNSVGPRQLKTNAVTGHDALESSFGKVPSAAHADSATNADHASQADSATTAANANTLDNLDSSAIGLGFFTGRVNDLATPPGGTKGSSPSGVDTIRDSTAVSGQDLTLSPSVPIVMRDLSVLMNQPLGCSGICGSSENATVTLESIDGSGSVSCTILTTQDSCSTAGPSATVSPRSRLRLNIRLSGDAQFTANSAAMFSWRATAP
jgi:hypothetical protein